MSTCSEIFLRRSDKCRMYWEKKKFTVVTDIFAVPNFHVSLEFASAEISAILFFAIKILVHDTHIHVDHPYTHVRKSVIER